MSVYIRGMEMPENCMLCPFCVEEADPANGAMCMVTGKLMPPCTRERLDSCPLIPVPDNGELIERKRLNDVCYTHFEDFMEGKIDGKTALLNIEKEIKAAPTIPAADVATVKRGRWRWRGFNIQCPFCEYEPFFESTEPLYNYCPNCGAKMEETE